MGTVVAYSERQMDQWVGTITPPGVTLSARSLSAVAQKVGQALAEQEPSGPVTEIFPDLPDSLQELVNDARYLIESMAWIQQVMEREIDNVVARLYGLKATFDREPVRPIRRFSQRDIAFLMNTSLRQVSDSVARILASIEGNPGSGGDPVDDDTDEGAVIETALSHAEKVMALLHDVARNRAITSVTVGHSILMHTGGGTDGDEH